MPFDSEMDINHVSTFIVCNVMINIEQRSMCQVTYLVKHFHSPTYSFIKNSRLCIKHKGLHSQRLKPALSDHWRTLNTLWHWAADTHILLDYCLLTNSMTFV